jgi:LmbE family N-acetylglucosaminyl deacetylase
VLAIGSHPDDIEFGCGGTLHSFVMQGSEVYALIMTDGSAGGNPQKRRKEQNTSAAMLGVTKIFWAGLKDTRLPFYEDVIQRIEKVVRKIMPDYVLVHYGKDTHQDHRHVSTCTVAATRNVANVLFYEGPTTYDFDPNVFVDIRNSLKVKFGSLSCHQSQVSRTNVQSQTILDIARATAIFRGTQCRRPFAEAFASLRMFLTL